MSIKTRLIIISLLFAAISSILFVVSFYVVDNLAESLTYENYAGQTRYRTYRLAWLIEEYLDGETYLEPAINKDIEEFESLLMALRGGSKEYKIEGIKDPEIFSRLNQHIKDWNTIKSFFSQRKTKGFERERVNYTTLVENYVNNLDATVALYEAKNKTKREVALLIYLFMAFSLTVFLIYLFYIYRQMSASIGSIMKGISGFSSGDFRTRIQVASKDEIGAVASTLNTMAANLEELYARLNHTVDQLTRANYELERKNRVITRTATVASHEFKNPLTSIKGFAHALLRENARINETERRKYLSIINSETDRLSKLIDECLDMARVEVGQIVLNLALSSPAQIIRDIADQKNIPALETDIREDMHDIRMDKGKIEQVILNLLDNALKYSPKEGKIKIAAFEQGNFIKVAVDDEGPGIKEHEREKVFDAFYRTPSDSTQKIKGLGIGLYICKGIIEAHGGRIWIEEKEGRGTRVAFTLPKGDKKL